MMEANHTLMKSIPALSACALLALAPPPAIAAGFCVTTAAQLQSALQTAQANGENDTIRVRTGTYDAPVGGFPVGGFHYLAAAGEHFDLELTGGWHPFGQTPCGWHDDAPWTTVLDGNDMTPIMTLDFGDNVGDVRVGRLLFLDGHFESYSSAGLEITASSDAGGNVTVEGNAFLNNFSYLAAGLEVKTSGTVLAVVNNLFILNEAGANISAAYLLNWGGEQSRVVFTNNTVISNHLSQAPDEDATATYFIASRLLLLNNNFWDNDGFDLDITGAGVRSVFNNNYLSVRLYGTTGFEDNISIVPEYESGFLNFTPTRGSALVDAGREPSGIDPGWYLTDVDLNGAQRKVGPHVDIGAFENERILVDGFDPGRPFGLLE